MNSLVVWAPPPPERPTQIAGAPWERGILASVEPISRTAIESLFTKGLDTQPAPADDLRRSCQRGGRQSPRSDNGRPGGRKAAQVPPLCGPGLKEYGRSQNARSSSIEAEGAIVLIETPPENLPTFIDGARPEGGPQAQDLRGEDGKLMDGRGVAVIHPGMAAHGLHRDAVTADAQPAVVDPPKGKAFEDDVPRHHDRQTAGRQLSSLSGRPALLHRYWQPAIDRQEVVILSWRSIHTSPNRPATPRELSPIPGP